MSDSILNIRPVKRGSAKLVIGLCGPSGAGKTYSALQMALGLARGNPRCVGLLDTESRRGSMYSDIYDLPNEERPFLIGDLDAPFSPDRYAQAMREFADVGIEALVIDTMSHEHEGEGGLEEMANASLARGKKTADWIGAKRAHKRMMNTLLYLPFHVVVCFRAREKMDFKNKGPNGEPVTLGIQPICEKNTLFEMTASFMLHDEGSRREVIKLPSCLRPILAGDGYLTPEHGKKLRDWIADPIERASNVLRLAASQGSEKLREAWMELDKAEQSQLKTLKDTLKQTAASADEDAKQQDNGAPENE